MVILKTLVGNLSANVNEITFTDNIIDGNSIIEVYYNSNDIYTVETWQREHTIGIVTSDHNFPVSVKVLINNVVAFSPYDDSQVLSQLSDLDGRVTDAEDAISGLATRVGDAEDDIDALENSKQDTLTAGDNITIENNIISATDSSNIYTETERLVGSWIDGKPIYKKTVRYGYCPNNATESRPHGISNIDKIVKFDAFGWSDINNSLYPIPFVQRSNVNIQIQFSIGRVNIDIATGTDIFTTLYIYVTMYYTKTTD